MSARRPARLTAFERPASWEQRGRTERAELCLADPSALPSELTLPSGKILPLEPRNVSESGGLAGCLACGHPELYTQKDFPRAVGLAVVVAAALAAPFTMYLSLGAAAVVDWVLYLRAPDVVVCYVCASEHRGFARRPGHPRFDREIEERLRYGERAVMGRPMREGGTAGAPEPDH